MFEVIFNPVVILALIAGTIQLVAKIAARK